MRRLMTSYYVVSMLKQPLVSRGKDFVWNELSDYVKNELGDMHFSTDFLRKLSTFC